MSFFRYIHWLYHWRLVACSTFASCREMLSYFQVLICQEFNAHYYCIYCSVCLHPLRAAA
jgi:hypothetical protein